MVLGTFEVLCIALPLLLWGLYWYFTKTYDYWKKMGIHYKEPTILFGNIKDRLLFRKSFHENQRDIHMSFKGHKFAGYFESRRPILIVRDPELIKHILVRDFQHFVDRPTLAIRGSPYIVNMLINMKGQHWKNVRALLTPTFSSGKLKAMENLVEQCGQHMATFLHNESNKNTTADGKYVELEMKSFFERFTLDVIATCAFGIECNSLKDPDCEFVKIASRFNDISIFDRILILFVVLLVPQFAHLFRLRLFNGQVTEFLVNVVKKTKEYRSTHKEQKWNDFLQLMIDAAEEEKEGCDEKQDNSATNNSKKASAAVLNEETIIAQALLFLLAGFETSSTLLTYTSYELALNQDIQQKLRKEIEEVLEKHGGQCSYEALLEMNYLDMVLLESLRKHPPAGRLDRLCTQPYTIPGTNINLEKGCRVCISVIGLHHDPEHFPQPEVYDPDRFLPAQTLTRSPYVFLPFGAGPRNCIGTRFALISTKTAMVHLIKNFQLTPSPKTEIPYKFDKFSMFLKAENGIWLNIQKV